MTEVRISNARRIGFTALALVTFWALAWRVYWIACGNVFETVGDHLRYHSFTMFLMLHFWIFLAPSLALVPLVLIGLALHQRIVRDGLNDTRVLMTGLILASAMGFIYWLGKHDGFSTVADRVEYLDASAWPDLTLALSPLHTVSAWSLLTAVAMVSGCVIVAITRSTVERTPRVGSRRSRRLVLTLVAIAVLIALAVVSYDAARTIAGCRSVGHVSEFPGVGLLGSWWWWFLFGASLAVLPIVPLSLSVCSSPLRIRDPWMLSSALLCAATLGLCSLRGARDYWIVLDNTRDTPSLRWSELEFPVSWFMLVPPMCLTLAVMIYGAWRRAVRDAMLELVDEDE